jgi:hypothetical protein
MRMMMMQRLKLKSLILVLFLIFPCQVLDLLGVQRPELRAKDDWAWNRHLLGKESTILEQKH